MGHSSLPYITPVPGRFLLGGFVYDFTLGQLLPDMSVSVLLLGYGIEGFSHSYCSSTVRGMNGLHIKSQ